jgi:hypothetical protein
MSWYVAAMLGAIVLAWLVIEVGLIRRIAVLTRRAAAVSHNVQQDAQGERGIGQLDVSDLRGTDELGILAGGLSDLLQRGEGDVQREQLRAQRERDTLQAVGHEILSPLQSLMVLHPDPTTRRTATCSACSRRCGCCTARRRRARRWPPRSWSSRRSDLDAFLRDVADNARFAGIADVR